MIVVSKIMVRLFIEGKKKSIKYAIFVKFNKNTHKKQPEKQI